LCKGKRGSRRLQELDEEFENPEFHAKYGSAWRGDAKYREALLDARRWMYRDAEFLRLLSKDSFFTGFQERMAKVEEIKKIGEQRRIIRRQERLKREREAVEKGAAAAAGPVVETEEMIRKRKNEEWDQWVETFRPPGVVTSEEVARNKWKGLIEARAAEREAELAQHRSFLASLKEVNPELKREIEDTREELLDIAMRQAAEAAAGGAKPGAPAAAGAAANATASAPGEPTSSIPGRSTALVLGPEPSAWEKWKATLPSFRRSRLYQRTLEWKESMEESQNPMVAKTMDTVGAAADVASRVVNKVRGGSETANALARLKAAWPHFDQVSFWKETVRRLPKIVRAFHERDLKWIKENCSPEMFDVLVKKSDDLCRSPTFPNTFFYSFIVNPPKSAEIITCVTDDPMRPYMMLRFSLQKTAERFEPPEPPIVPPTEWRYPLNSVNWVKSYPGVDYEKAKRCLPIEFHAAIPGQGLSEYAWDHFRKSMRRIGKGQPVYGRMTERERIMAALKESKVVKAVYVMVLQYDPERDMWLVHNFEQAILDITF
jgi:hypothetical protein